MTMYRPTGPAERLWIAASGLRRVPHAFMALIHGVGIQPGIATSRKWVSQCSVETESPMLPD